MIEIRRQEDLYHHERSWLKTDWHFSFGEYRDPQNDNFGVLSVVNNDYIDPEGGFPSHSHDNMEIITWVVEGELAHEDSTGSEEFVPANGVQTMSAGTGISHSEYNPSDSERLHLLQVWIEPSQHDVEPRYEDSVYETVELRGGWVPVASGQSEQSGTSIYQDATLYIRHTDGEETFDYRLSSDRRGYLIVIDGETRLDDKQLASGDAARVRDENILEFEVTGPAKLILIDLP